VLASGSLVQQISQVAGLLVMTLILTVLARELTASELGVFGLLTSLAGYLLVMQNAAASAAVRNMAIATDDRERAGAFSTAVLIYAAAGALTGVLLVALGFVLAEVIDMQASLRSDTRIGSIALGLVTMLGWPLTIFRDALRASQRFARAALMDIVGSVAYGLLVLGLAVGGAPLWLLIGVSGTIPMFAGAASFVAFRLDRLPYRFHFGAVTRAEVGSFVRLGGHVSAIEAAGVIIYALDRIILGIFRPVATVALFEGPVRVHNLVRALNGALNVTVLPTAAKYVGEGDAARLRELLVRGSRYALAIVLPITVTLMVLAEPLLEVWLGEQYGDGALALTILVGYWLFNGSTGIVGSIAVAGGRASTIARYAWTMAIGNLALSLALTPWLGLEGVALGTTIPYLVMFPFVVRLVLQIVDVPLGELVRRAWMPSYLLGLGLAGGLVVARLTLDLFALLPLVTVALCGPALFWIAYYLIWLEDHERELVRDVLAGFVSRRRV